MRRDVLAGIAIVIAIFLSAANLVLLVGIFQTKQRVGEAVRAGIGALGATSSAVLVASVAVDEVFPIPIRTTVPIKTVVVVPISVPILGQVVSATVPIDAQVPVDTVIRVPVKATIPVRIGLGDIGLVNTLQQFLGEFADALR